MLLEVRDIHVDIDRIPILRGVSLDVDKGETVVLLGRNGAGKTTTMRSIMGILPKRKGKIVFDGVDITRMRAHQVAKLGIGYAPEDRKIFPDLTVEENIEIAIRNPGEREEIFREVYTIFPKLKELSKRKGGFLSGGEQKMLAIARALATRPKLLLLDEPFEGLAPVIVRRFYEAINKIKETGLPILVADSNIVHARSIADRVYVIERGEILFHGDAKEILESDKVMKVLRGY